MNYDLVGQYYAGSEELIEKLLKPNWFQRLCHRKKTPTIILKAEPNNPYDHEAVLVFYKNIKLGYVNRNQNHNLALYLQTEGNVAGKLIAPRKIEVSDAIMYHPFIQKELQKQCP